MAHRRHRSPSFTHAAVVMRGACIAAAAFLAGCTSETPQPAAADRDGDEKAAHETPGDALTLYRVKTGIAAGYVNDTECANCHGALSRTFRDVAMARTFAPARVRDGDVIEDFDNNHIYHDKSAMHYRMEHRGDHLVLVAWQDGPDGRPINTLEQRVDWYVGSGNHIRAYLYQTPSGELFQLPIVWYTQQNAFGMAAGFDRPDHFGFTRPIQRDCIFCHAATPELPVGADHYGAAYRYPHDFTTGIGCQRCHGPGAEHLRLADEDAPLESIRASIVNPARLPRTLADDICMQCHFQPTSERASILRRFDLGDFDYRPGERLEDYILHFDFGDNDLRAERFEINHHGYRLIQSPCYIESAGALRCTTCHDAHHTLAPEDRNAFHRAACMSCHEGIDSSHIALSNAWLPPDTPPDDCITCHMPLRHPSDGPDALVHDHFIRRFPLESPAPVPAFPADNPTHADLVMPGDDAIADPMVEALYAHIVRMKSGLGITADDLDAAIGEAALDARDPELMLADLLRAEGRPEEAAEQYARAVARNPDDPYPRIGLGDVLLASGDADAAIREFEAAVSSDPVHADAHERLASALLGADRVDEALAHYREAIRLRPHFPEAHYNLAGAHVRLGQIDHAVTHYRNAVAIDPNLTSAYLQLGDLLRAQGDVSDALRYWRHGASIAPEQTDFPMLIAETALTAPDPADRDTALALEFASRAIEQAPDEPRPRLLAAFALLMNREPAQAEQRAEESLAAGGDLIDVSLITALARAQVGDQQSALTHLRRAQAQLPPGSRPRDPVRQALLSIAQQMFNSR